MKKPILVVDDIPLTLDLVRHNLQTAGFNQTVVFDDPIGALEAVTLGLRPALLITDYDMPGLNGIQLIESIERVCPGVPSIIATADPGLLRSSSRSSRRVLKKGSPDFFPRLLEEMCAMLGKTMVAPFPRMVAA